MTVVDVAFQLGRVPRALELQAMQQLREVYGIRKISFEENGRTVRVEYDASRLVESTVAALLRRAGFDVKAALT